MIIEIIGGPRDGTMLEIEKSSALRIPIPVHIHKILAEQPSLEVPSLFYIDLPIQRWNGKYVAFWPKDEL